VDCTYSVSPLERANLNHWITIVNLLIPYVPLTSGSVKGYNEKMYNKTVELLIYSLFNDGDMSLPFNDRKINE
jgi:hypothetical protein